VEGGGREGEGGGGGHGTCVMMPSSASAEVSAADEYSVHICTKTIQCVAGCCRVLEVLQGVAGRYGGRGERSGRVLCTCMYKAFSVL